MSMKQKHRHSFYVYLSLIFVIQFLSGCISSQQGIKDDKKLPASESTSAVPIISEKEQTQVDSALPTREIECTLLGCRNTISIEINGPSLSEFIVETIDKTQKRTILHCLPSEFESDPIFYQEYQLNTSEISKVLDISPTPQMCGDNQDGYAGIWQANDSLANKIVIQCSQPDLMAFRNAFLSAECFGSNNQRGFSFSYADTYAPEDIPIIIYWDVYSKTVQLQPTYRTERPNGPRCEPVCSFATITIDLP